MQKDGTAQGIAKVRHYESLLPPEQQLYHDPYAYAMFPGSIVQQWMGPAFIAKLYQWMGLGGFNEMISIRTRWLDDEIVTAAKTKKEEGGGARQLIILGAGYDTRGFRLDLWNDNDNDKDEDEFAVVEVDQPDVQKKKIANLNWLIQQDEKWGQVISKRMNESKKVQFLPVDFNTDDLQQKLCSLEGGFQPNQCSVVTLEGVTQYIPKESTADTLKKLKDIIGSGSTVLITYVDQKCFEEEQTNDANNSSLTKRIGMIKRMAAKVGEPWISGWTKDEFASFLKDCGYDIVSDTTQEDYNDGYLQPVGRKLEDEDILNIERFVVAKVL